MLLPTFAEVKDSRLRQVAASCATSEDFKSLVNTATDLLMQRGDWPGTIVPIRCSARAGCVVWPRYVQRVRRINLCRIPIKVSTIWYDFVDKGDYFSWCAQGFYAWSGDGYASRGLAQANSLNGLVSQGRTPCINDIPSDKQCYLRFYPLCSKDVGKTITVFGVDVNQQPLQTRDASGFYTDGLTVTLASPFASTPVQVARVDAIRKDVTQRIVPAYAYDPVSNTQLTIGLYEPGEKNPSYAKDRLFDSCSRNGQPGCELPLVALVKLAFIPVVADTDIVTIPSMEALKMAVQSVKAGEAGKIGDKVEFMQLAVNELNFVLENEQPLDQTPVDPGFMGGTRVGMQQCV